MTSYSLSSVATETATVSVTFDQPDEHPHYRERGRRLVNVAAAAMLLILAAPIMAVVALAIWLTDRSGPIIYKQVRVGLCTRRSRSGHIRRKVDLGGRPFTIYKFRTMRATRPGEEQQVWAAENDPRITKLGKFLRKTRLDELPQLWNVLLGDMNVVGPRPEQPKIFESLRDEVPQYAARQQVRPGITGLAQITLSYDTSVEDVRRKVEADLKYIERQSALEDLRIMALTAPVMLLRKGSR